jgi:hypothetical protein
MIKKIIFVMIMVMFMAIPVSANVTYQDDYYNLKTLTSDILNDSIKVIGSSFSYTTFYSAIYNACRAEVYQLQAQTMLMEKQNELLDEQNNLMRQQMNSTLICDQFAEYDFKNHYKCRYVMES